ncbi:MAG: NAD-dependent epimerase/dehydratase family protein [Acidobacteria bacterium]|nr:NAD-dependent epimerase/dehydratase family protein [Acidobacteriota bacterium]
MTGGGGFVGSLVVDTLRARGYHSVFAPRKRDYDLTWMDGIEKMFADARPEVLSHLAAVVGEIGANRLNPGSFLYENVIIGIQLSGIQLRHSAERSRPAASGGQGAGGQGSRGAGAGGWGRWLADPGVLARDFFYGDGADRPAVRLCRPSGVGHDATKRPAAARAEKCFGFRAETSLEAGLQQTIDWCKKTASKP